MLNAVREELLDYDSFVSFIKKMLHKKMGKGYDIEICKVVNNSLIHDSLTVLKEGRNFAPNISLNAYYESYIAGTSMAEILKRLCMIYRHCAIPAIQDFFDYSLDALSSYIFFRLINFERNAEILTQIPHKTFLDMAITFHCLIRREDDSISSIRITKEHIKKWGITVDDLQELAHINTRKLFPPALKSIDEVIEEPNDFEDYESKDACPMYVLTNEKGIYGAFYILYKDVIRDFARLINSNLYILPSSIHEIILVPAEDGLEKEHLNRLILEINESFLSADEILSDNVYVYSLGSDDIA